MVDVISKLVRECNAARGRGVDFPTIWQTVLKAHPYVAGHPKQGLNDSGPFLEVPLITGRHLVYDPSGFRLG